MQIRPFEDKDTDIVVALWGLCELIVPWNDPRKDIERKRQVGPDLFLVGTVDDVVLASVMGGYEGHRGWMNYLAVHPAHRRKGYGQQLAQALETKLLAQGCPKINLQIRQGNTAVQAFYESIGFSDDKALSMGKRIIPDN